MSFPTCNNRMNPPEANHARRVLDSSLDDLAMAELPLARGSLFHAALYAAASRDECALVALQLVEMQDRLLETIADMRLVDFPDPHDLEACREHLDANIDRMTSSHPLLVQYRALHARRHEFLPTLC